MPTSKCINCGCYSYRWRWEEAFDKFGFNDGGEQVETFLVEEALIQAGYDVTVDDWGIHNILIFSIKKDGQELMPVDNPDFTIGYSDPRSYLPSEIVEYLDETFPSSDL